MTFRDPDFRMPGDPSLRTNRSAQDDKRRGPSLHKKCSAQGDRRLALPKAAGSSTRKHCHPEGAVCATEGSLHKPIDPSLRTNRSAQDDRRGLLSMAASCKSIVYTLAAVFLVLLSTLAPTSPARADGTSPDPLTDPAFDQKMGAQVPLDLTFQDEQGRTIRLDDYLGEKPAILLYAYYNCQNLCSIVLRDLALTMKDLSFDVGNQFQVVTVSMDPRETPQVAAKVKTGFIQAYGRPGAAEGWHFLTGDKPAIDQLAQAVGFHYVYDAKTDQFAHPTGVMVLTPQGKVARYLLGIDYSSTELRLALVEASARKIATPTDTFMLLCYGYDPHTGRYSLAIHNILRLAGTVTAIGLGAFVWILARNEKKPAKSPQGGNETRPGEDRERQAG